MTGRGHRRAEVSGHHAKMILLQVGVHVPVKTIVEFGLVVPAKVWSRDVDTIIIIIMIFLRKTINQENRAH